MLKEATFAYYIPKWFLERIPRQTDWDLTEEEWPGSLVIEIENADNFLESGEPDSAVLEYSYIESKKNS
jgi:hypothetical protein